MNYYIISPAKLTTGGVELAHQMCAELISFGMKAKMYYINMDEDTELPYDVDTEPRYQKYVNQHVTDKEDVNCEEVCLIIPEGFSDWAFLFPKAKKLFWWMSVDNFVWHGEQGEFVQQLDQEISMHLVQSAYAREFLLSHHIKPEKILFLGDYIGEAYGKFLYPMALRQDYLLYNPRKGYEAIKPLIEATPELTWIPLVNRTEEEMILLMESSKIYVDFGSHPGRDRIPREAVSCGCCILTNYSGSAALYEDVPIDDDYKFHDPIDYEAVRSKIIEILNDFPNHWEKFVPFRERILQEREQFRRDVLKVLALVESTTSSST